MKILVVQDHLRSGGTERQSILLTRAFGAAGHPTTLLTFRPGGTLGRDLAGIDHRSLQSFDTHLDWFAPGLVRTVGQLAPDVILCMGRMANCWAGSIQRARPAIPVVATMRTGKPLPFLFRRSLRLARHIIANSHAARENLVRGIGVSPDRVTVIHNSLVFPARASDEAGTRFRADEGAGSGTIVLLCVAMFRRRKNQRELIEIAAGLPADVDWQLWLAGDGETRGACERFAGEHGLRGRVKFPGWQPDPGPLYCAADVAVHASSSESLSNFIIEAQAHGLPAVVYEAQGIAECFIPGDTGVVIPRGDREAFRRAVLRFAQAPAEERAAIAARARAQATAAFDPQQHVRDHLDLFARLAGNAPG